jgi:hypothetical protein
MQRKRFSLDFAQSGVDDDCGKAETGEAPSLKREPIIDRILMSGERV